MSDTCKHCDHYKHTGDACAAVSPDGLHCTREPDHDGQHVACGIGPMHDLERWEDA